MNKNTQTNEEWIKRWSQNQIGFHQSSTTPYLEKYFDMLECRDSNIFVPLCGKSLDMIWLSKSVKKVIGVELSQKAIDDFVLENNLSSTTTQEDSFLKYAIGNIDIFVGDLFDFEYKSNEEIAIFDRASLVALDSNTRKLYVDKILKILNSKMLLVTLDFPSTKKSPPFGVSNEEVHELYGDKCNIELLQSIDLVSTDEKFRGLSYAYERVFLIDRK